MSEILFFLGRPFSPFYSLLMKARELAYQKGLLKTYRPSVPVVSVGNLTMGGTGKTPVVQAICRYLQGKKIKPAIVSRGYGGRAKEEINLVSDGNRVLLSADQSGDEPQLHGELLPGVIVATGKDRKPVCRYVENEFGCQTIVLDDGFQHLGVKRDIDLVLFSSSILAGNSRVFPGGDLREPVSALNRADAFILTGTNETNRERAGLFGELLQKRFGNKPVFFSSTEIYGARKAGHHDVISLNELPSPLFGFCGIAGPERFRESLDELGMTICGFSFFKDHNQYSDSDIQQLTDQAKQSGAAGLITTEKDLIKLDPEKFDLPLHALLIQTTIKDNFWNFLEDTLQNI